MFNQMQTAEAECSVKAGDTVVVSGYKAKVESVFYDPEFARIQITLNWGSLGRSKVYAHDENKTWKKLNNCN